MQKIKKDLIHKAKIKKEYAKLKKREDAPAHKSVYDREPSLDGTQGLHEPADPAPEPSLEPHPDRLRMLEDGDDKPELDPEHPDGRSHDRRNRRTRSQPFKKETELAEKRRAEAEARQRAKEQAEKERARKLAERERFRNVMAKARGGPNGKRKLGRESTVLLEKAKRLVANT